MRTRSPRPEIMAMVRDIGNARSEIAATRSSPSAGGDLGNGQASGFGAMRKLACAVFTRYSFRIITFNELGEGIRIPKRQDNQCFSETQNEAKRLAPTFSDWTASFGNDGDGDRSRPGPYSFSPLCGENSEPILRPWQSNRPHEARPESLHGQHRACRPRRGRVDVVGPVVDIADDRLDRHVEPVGQQALQEEGQPIAHTDRLARDDEPGEHPFSDLCHRRLIGGQAVAPGRQRPGPSFGVTHVQIRSSAA